MVQRVLQIVDTPYRCTIEEQDDPVLWITQAMKGAGGDFAVLLRGSAVNYAVRGQDASGLRFGQKAQTQPARIDQDLAKLVAKGIPVFAVEEDLRERGLGAGECVDGVKAVARSEVARLFGEYDAVWHW